MRTEPGICHLESVIRAHLQKWGTVQPYVELAIHGTDDARAISEAIDTFCREHLGSGVLHGLFHQASNGSVTGVELDDGRLIVMKAHRPSRSLNFLHEIVRLQSHLAAKGCYAAPVIAGPLPLGFGHIIVEEHRSTGSERDAHEAPVRRELARSFSRIIGECRPFVADSGLPELLRPAEGQLWAASPGAFFDFESTAPGAEWIDEIAALAYARMTPAGVRVIGHADWRQEHVRFSGDEIAVAYDWDSLHCDLEPVLLATAALVFCSSRGAPADTQVPTVREIRAFKSVYEQARGTLFTRDESRLFAASVTYWCAYTSRCEHAQGNDWRNRPGSFQHLLWHGHPGLLEL